MGWDCYGCLDAWCLFVLGDVGSIPMYVFCACVEILGYFYSLVYGFACVLSNLNLKLHRQSMQCIVTFRLSLVRLLRRISFESMITL